MSRTRLDKFSRWPMLPPNAQLMPTHKCFDDPFHFIAALPESLLHTIKDRLTVVHALLRTPSGDTIAHAWLEGEANLFFTIAGGESEPIIWQRAVCSIEQHERVVWYCIVAKPFYTNVIKHTRYTLALAAELSQIHGMHGPWRGEYLPHCGRGNKPPERIPNATIVGVFEQLPVDHEPSIGQQVIADAKRVLERRRGRV